MSELLRRLPAPDDNSVAFANTAAAWARHAGLAEKGGLLSDEGVQMASQVAAMYWPDVPMRELGRMHKQVLYRRVQCLASLAAGKRGRGAVQFGSEFAGLVLTEAHKEHAAREGAIERQTVVRKLIDTVLSLREASHHDSLTGLRNRAGWADMVGRLMEAGRLKDVAVFFVDIDQFKEVNDRLGHDTGDMLLGALGALLQDDTRGSDVVMRAAGDIPKQRDEAPQQGLTSVPGRHGGDEFVIALSFAAEDQAAAAGHAESEAQQTRQSADGTPRRRTARLPPEERAERYKARLQASFSGMLQQDPRFQRIRDAKIKGLGLSIGVAYSHQVQGRDALEPEQLLALLVKAAGSDMGQHKESQRRGRFLERPLKERRRIEECLAELAKLGVFLDQRMFGFPLNDLVPEDRGCAAAAAHSPRKFAKRH